MITILKNVQPGCQIIIDSASELKNYDIFYLECKTDSEKIYFFKISPLSFFLCVKQEKHRPRSSQVCKNSAFDAPSGTRTLDK